jgi:cadmium resistance protein CadD (predicted permease)
MNLITLLGLGIVLFASTNFDDIFLLIGFFAYPRFRARNVAIGQYGDVTLTCDGCNGAVAINFQAATVTDFHSAIALRR